MGFNERKKLEDEYIEYWIKKYPKWKQNLVGPLPDLTKPDGTYQDVKFVDINNKYNNGFLLAQKKGIRGSEIDDWKKNRILEQCEYKFIKSNDSKIYIINCKIFIDNVFKEYNERKPTDEYSGTAFYMVRINDFYWTKIDREIFQNKIYDVYQCDNVKQFDLDSWY